MVFSAYPFTKGFDVVVELFFNSTVIFITSCLGFSKDTKPDKRDVVLPVAVVVVKSTAPIHD